MSDTPTPSAPPPPPAVPPAVQPDDATRELEQRLRRDPGNEDAKVDVGSDESMDASDPPAASQPGCSDEPMPSSTFPEPATDA